MNCMRTLKDGGGVCPHCGFDAAKYKPPNDALPPGSVLNDEKYVIGRVLGRGGFGVTYVALDQNLGLRVAVKECLPQRDARRNASGASVQWSVPVHEQETAMENFVREARKMAQIYGISGVVPVREYFYDNETAYIVMDYVDGETLSQRLRRTGPLSARECFRLLSPVMESLAQAHGRGLVHRDIKPNNIMIERTRDGEKIWLLDLGAAKDLGTRFDAPNVSAESRIIGTPGYTPLEQCSPDGRIGPWTDVYSMSATFFYCMTGNNPPDSRSRFMETQTPQVLLSVPGAVGDVLRKGMALRPGERYQTMAELRNALEKAVNDTADTRDYENKTEVLPETSATKPPRPKWAFAVLIALALLVSVFAVVMFLRREPSAEIIASGECGENVSWTLDADGLLTISGAGDMADYTNYPSLTTPWAERNGSIVRVKIAEGITSIGTCAFSLCKNMKDVEIPDSVTTINGGAFDNCIALKSVEIPDSVTTINGSAFNSCIALKSVEIPDSVTTIKGNAFYYCIALKSVEIPDSVTTIGDRAFGECSSLTDFTIPSNITTIQRDTFLNCTSLTNVTIPDSVTAIGENAFRECASLNSVTMSQNVTTIGEYAFNGCGNLSSVVVPAGATIADSAFDENTTVTTVETSPSSEPLSTSNESLPPWVEELWDDFRRNYAWDD